MNQKRVDLGDQEGKPSEWPITEERKSTERYDTRIMVTVAMLYH